MSELDFAQPPLYTGAKAPESVTATILSGLSGVDLTTVTGVVFNVMIGAVTVQWAATIVSARTDKLVAKHTFDNDGKETEQGGRYRIQPVLTIPAGTVRVRPFYLAVVE